MIILVLIAIYNNDSKSRLRMPPRVFWLGLLYVLFPLNLLVYGLNEDQLH